ncbi:MAG: nucleotidyltransferase domain-containing protein [Proteobacteria bacterium]|nr:nucleotidyltransferase domain-containing protein [Pseudomonadota bacterium]
MQRDDAIHLLKQAEPGLRARGVTALALFGSTARDEATEDSDVDVMVDLDMSRQPTLVDLSGMRLLIEDTLRHKADLAIRDSLRPTYRTNIEADAIRIF